MDQHREDTYYKSEDRDIVMQARQRRLEERKLKKSIPLSRSNRNRGTGAGGSQQSE